MISILFKIKLLKIIFFYNNMRNIKFEAILSKNKYINKNVYAIYIFIYYNQAKLIVFK